MPILHCHIFHWCRGSPSDVPAHIMNFPVCIQNVTTRTGSRMGKDVFKTSISSSGYGIVSYLYSGHNCSRNTSLQWKVERHEPKFRRCPRIVEMTPGVRKRRECTAARCPHWVGRCSWRHLKYSVPRGNNILIRIRIITILVHAGGDEFQYLFENVCFRSLSSQNPPLGIVRLSIKWTEMNKCKTEIRNNLAWI